VGLSDFPSLALASEFAAVRASALDVLDHAGRRLAAATSADVWCGVLLDPSTMLDTGGHHEHGFPADVMGRLFELEHLEPVGETHIRALAARKETVNVLSTSGAELDRSPYYQDVLRPLGLVDEMRVLLRDGERVWGLVVLCHDAHTRAFSPRDVEFAGRLAGPATDALRRVLLVNGIDVDLPDASGIVSFDAEAGVTSMSGTAGRWLAEVPESGAKSADGCPYSVRALVTRVLGLGPGATARSLTPSRSGRWLVMQAWRMEAADGPEAVVSIGPAGPADLVALILEVYGLTAREREIAQQVLLGRSTAEIARRLGVTPYTVQDHLKAVFAKAGVHSRRELTAALFFQQYLPQIEAPAVSTDGRLARSPH
jgi:DNA-binding CsgD family transcriptional regulator